MEHPRGAQQALERPRHAGRRRLVTGGEDRDQLVSQLQLAERRARLVGRPQQQRQDVVALLQVGLRAPPLDLRVEESVEGGPCALEAHPRAAWPQVAPHRRKQADRMRAIRELLDQRSRLLEPCLVTDPEHRPENHVERDRPQPLVQRKRLTDGPGRDLLLGNRANRVLPAADVLSVKRAQQQLAVAHVRLVVEREQGVAADGRLQYRLARLAGVERAGVAREHLAHQVRIGDADDQPHAGKPRGANRAIAAGEPPDVADRVKRVADTVDDRGHPRPGKLCSSRHNARRYHPPPAHGDRRSRLTPRRARSPAEARRAV